MASERSRRRGTSMKLTSSRYPSIWTSGLAPKSRSPIPEANDIDGQKAFARVPAVVSHQPIVPSANTRSW